MCPIEKNVMAGLDRSYLFDNQNQLRSYVRQKYLKMLDEFTIFLEFASFLS